MSAMIHSIATPTQVWLATQSVSLVNQFTPQEILVLDQIEEVSTTRRLKALELSPWLMNIVWANYGRKTF